MSRSMMLFLVIGVPILALLLACLGAATFIDNLTGLLLFVIGIAFLAGPPIYYMRTKQPYWLSGRGRISQEEKGDASFWFILPGFLLVFFRFAARILIPAGFDRPQDCPGRIGVSPVYPGIRAVYLGPARHARSVFRTYSDKRRSIPGEKRTLLLCATPCLQWLPIDGVRYRDRIIQPGRSNIRPSAPPARDPVPCTPGGENPFKSVSNGI